MKHRRQSRFQIAAALPFTMALWVTPVFVFTGPAERAIAQDGASATATDGKIIVGPVEIYGFQRIEPDDAGIDAAPGTVNIADALADLGDDARLWYQHVMTLSNPYFEGRNTGTEGNARAAAYIEFFFKQYGLEPAFPAPIEAAAEMAPVEGGDEGGSSVSGPAAAQDPVTSGAGLAVEEPAAAVVDAGAWTSYLQPFHVERGRFEIDSANVGGVLRGKGQLAEEWIVIGAHFDHVGYGGRRRRNAEGEEPAPRPLHPGADDNASGTAGMLILAKRFAERYANAGDDANLRSVLFLGFSGEEMGLLGSAHYVQNATLEADKINVMINLDMIGRLRKETLMVQGIDSAENFLEIIRPHLVESGLTIYADPAGQGPSDHARFYGGGIPVLFMFTGTHESYHQPSDHGWTVNPGGAIRIIDMTDAIAQDMTSITSRLKFQDRDAGGEG